MWKFRRYKSLEDCLKVWVTIFYSRLLKRDWILTTLKKVIACENNHQFLKSRVNLLFISIPLNQNLQTIQWSTQVSLEVSQHFSVLHHKRKTINISYLHKEFLGCLSLKPSQTALPILFFLNVLVKDWPLSKILQQWILVAVTKVTKYDKWKSL